MCHHWGASALYRSGDRLLQGILGTERLLQNYNNHGHCDIKEEGCKHTPCYNEYVHANVTETIENDGYV